MFEYRRDIFNSHLDKHPKYSFPETAQHALDDVQDLKPAVSMIQIHHHGNETAIVIEGSNLWFCYGVTFRKQKLSIPASNVSGSSIQFNRVFVPSDSEVLTNKEEGICLDNHFKSKSIKQEVEVFEKVKFLHYACTLVIMSLHILVIMHAVFYTLIAINYFNLLIN